MVRKIDDQEPEGRPGEGRLARWSRLKREAAVEKQPRSETMTAARVPAEAAPATPAADEAERQKKIDEATKDLPPIESLGKDSDYSLFMREGVPEETRTAALRKLWRSDPAFTEPFPFEMHMEDYNKTFVPINAATDTLFRAGVGYLFDDDKDKTQSSATTAETAPDESSVSAQKEIESTPREGALTEAPDAAGKKSAEEQISMSGKNESG
ncbi:MAG: DUF3306 domain-containing protein [Rhodospirillales bacterium]|nr:DUF3306 domain-containing protein [Rhodospirillales bacterium]